MTPVAVLLLVFINVLWGASSVATKYGLAGFGPCSLAMLRFIPSGLVLFAICHRRKQAVVIQKEDRLPLFLLAFVGITLTYAVLYTGIARTTATDASLLFACEPILIALMATVFLRERLRLVQWIGLFVGVVGIRLIAGGALGNWLALLGLAFESSTSVIAKRLVVRYPALLVLAYQLTLGGLLLLPMSIYEMMQHPPNLLPHELLPSVLLGTGYLLLCCTLLAYGVWYWLLEHAPVSEMGVFILIQPLVGPLFGWLLRGDRLQPSSLAGAGLVILGITLTTLIRWKR